MAEPAHESASEHPEPPEPTPAPEPKLLRITAFGVEGLFGYLNHRVDLFPGERVTILHGPNGVGKTWMLTLVQALLKGDLRKFAEVPLERFWVSFENEGALVVTRSLASAEDMVIEHAGHSDRKQTVPGGRLGPVPAPGAPEQEYSLPPFLEPGPAPEPWLSNLLSRTRAVMIDIHRIVPEEKEAPKSRYRSPPIGGGSANAEIPPKYKDQVRRRSLDFLDRTNAIMRQIGLGAILGAMELRDLVRDIDTRDIATKAAELEKDFVLRASRLNNLGLLEALKSSVGYHALPLRDGTGLTDAKGRELEARIIIAWDKIMAPAWQALDRFADKVELLVNALNDRILRNKGLNVDSKRGFIVRDVLGSEVPLEALSSGEKHMIVMMYDLIFRTEENTLIMIDEPELSLHPEWQRHFVPDLLQIARLNQIDIVLATHSAEIAGPHYELMAELSDKRRTPA